MTLISPQSLAASTARHRALRHPKLDHSPFPLVVHDLLLFLLEWYVESGSENATLRVWDGQTGNELARVLCTVGVTTIGICTVGPRVACGDRSGWVHAFDILPPAVPVAACAASNRGERRKRGW
jgi:hypothetical protein